MPQHPLAWLRARWRRWWMARLQPTDHFLLTQRSVYILPTRPGLMLAATLLVLLVASINYQLNLGYLLTFLLAGSALVGMHLGHGTLRGLTLQLQPPEPGFAGTPVALTVHLHHTRRTARHGIGLAVAGSDHWAWTDVPAQGRATVHVAFVPARRGLQALPPLTAETRFPLGTFRVWTVWRPASRVLVYPRPEARPPPLPAGEPRAGAAQPLRPLSSGEADGVRGYRRGDPLKLVVWKKAAHSGKLVSRDTRQARQEDLWLDLTRAGTGPGRPAEGHKAAGVPPPGAAPSAQESDPTLEHALARLCAWVLEADRRGQSWGLRLGSTVIAPASGEAHRRRCLEALALHGSAGPLPAASASERQP